MPRAIVLSAQDNVATLIDAGRKGEDVELSGERGGRIVLAADVPFGHKLALDTIRPGANILKYGEVIGRATTAIAPGEHVHVHNVEALRGRGDVDRRAS